MDQIASRHGDVLDLFGRRKWLDGYRIVDPVGSRTLIGAPQDIGQPPPPDADVLSEMDAFGWIDAGPTGPMVLTTKGRAALRAWKTQTARAVPGR